MDEKERVEIRPLPRIGDQAPAFEAETTWGRLALEDFRDRWLILFSHPADFTPVCTTEFLAFQELHQSLKDLG
ncbi:MAG: redoxin domain-containing protein, partial [Syntrophales bacterium]|nr:redoxin domain-containing protein [Syntrophales bacterium]